MPVSFDKQKKRWRFKFERVINGQSIRATKVLPAGYTRSEAEKYGEQETKRLFQVATGTKEPTIDDAILIYCQERCPQLKRGDEIIAQLRRDYENYAGIQISRLAEVAAKIRNLGISAGTQQNRIAYIRAALKYAHRFHGFERPPEIPTITVQNQRHEYLSRREMLAIASRTHRIDVQAIIRIAFYTGLRQSEILRAECIGDRLVIRDTKNAESIHIVPVHPKIKSAARRAPFSIPQHTLKWCWNAARVRAGLPQYRFHDLRHSAASEMINAGVDLYTVGVVLNHKSASSTRRYAHLATERIEEAISKIGSRK